MSLATLHRLRLLRASAASVGAAIVAAAAWWAWAVTPVATPSFDVGVVPPRADAIAAIKRTALPLEPFAKLAAAEPAPKDESIAAKADAPPVAPPAPIRGGAIELLGIVEENGAFRAALYLAALDSVVVVGADETVGGMTVRRVTASQIELVDARGARTIALAGPPSAAAGAARGVKSPESRPR